MTDEKTKELLTCPFCGAGAELKAHRGSGVLRQPELNKSWRVYGCRNSKCPLYHIQMTTEEWNARAVNKPAKSGTMEEILPCPNPWCALSKKPFLRWKLNGRQVVCNCGICGPISATRVTGGSSLEDENRASAEAISAWNTRPGCATASGQDGVEAVSHASPVRMSPPKVKLLEWRRTGTIGDSEQVSVGWVRYSVSKIFGSWRWIYTFIRDDGQIGYLATMALSKVSAKAAAQAHYEAMVLACLENEPSTPPNSEAE